MNKILKDYDSYDEKQLITQYELIRKAGMCNMFDTNCVLRIAQKFGHTELANFIAIEWIKGYSQILQNYQELMKTYDIKQE